MRTRLRRATHQRRFAMLSDQELIDGLRSGLATLQPRSDLIDRLRERAAADQPRDLPSRSPRRPRWLPPSARWLRWPLCSSRWLSAVARWCCSAAITRRVCAPPLHRSRRRRTRRAARGGTAHSPGDRAGRRAAQEQAPGRPRRATRGRPRDHTAPRSVGRADAERIAPPEYQSRRPARGLSRLVRVAHRCHRGVGVAYRAPKCEKKADTFHPVEPVPGEDANPRSRVLKETKWCAALISRGSAPASARAHRRSTPERGPGGRMRGKLPQPTAATVGDASPRRRPSRPPLQPALGRPPPAGPRPARARPRRAASARGRSHSRTACAPTACPLPRPAARRRRALRDTCRSQSRLARVQGGAGEVPEAPARRRPPRLGAPRLDQTLAKLLRIAACMRQHGIPDFPDPRTSAPASFPPGIAEIANFDGAVLLFPQRSTCRRRRIGRRWPRAARRHLASPTDRNRGVESSNQARPLLPSRGAYIALPAGAPPFARDPRHRHCCSQIQR